MSLKFKKLRSLLALTLSAAMVLTAVPEMSMVTNAAEIEEYQTSKLKVSVNKKNTTVYTGQKDVEVATVTYANTTKKEGKYFVGSAFYEKETYSQGEVFVYCPEIDKDYDYEGTGDGTLDGPNNGKTVLVAVDEGARPGKYTIKLSPVTPEGVCGEETSFTITVKASVAEVWPDSELHMLYKPANKAVSTQLKAYTYLWSSDYGCLDKNVIWTAYWDVDQKIPCGKDVTISKSGKLTIAKDFVPTEDKSTIYVFAEAGDRQGASNYTTIDVTKEPVATAAKMILVDTNTNEEIKPAASYTARELSDAMIVVQDAHGNDISDSFIFKSSNSKSIKVHSSYINVKKADGKAVTITAMAVDGSKNSKSLKLTVKKNAVSMNDICLSGSVGSYYKDLDTATAENSTVEYEAANESLLFVSIYSYSSAYYEDFADAKITKVSGGKNITSKYNANYSKIEDVYIDYGVVIQPTSDTVEVTVKAGKETKVFTYKNTAYVAEKLTAKKGEKLTTSITLANQNATQEIKLHIGKDLKGKTIQISEAEDLASNLGQYGTALFVARMLGGKGMVMSLPNEKKLTVDENGDVVISVAGVTSMIESLNEEFKWIKSEYGISAKLASSVKLYMNVYDEEGNTLYAPTVLSVKIGKAKASTKLDFKLQKDYKLSATESMSFNGVETKNYAKVAYTGKTAPTADYAIFTIFGADLSDNLKAAGPWAQAVKVYVADNMQDAYLYIDEEGMASLAEYYGKTGNVSGYVYVAYAQQNAAGTIGANSMEKVKVTVTLPENVK